jgi:7,8-dihydroneopterin aldolase/epimerase/oxygenase
MKEVAQTGDRVPGTRQPQSTGAIDSTYRLCLREYVTRARIGIYPRERRRPQPLVVSVDLELLRPERIHGIEDVFDYNRIAACVEAMCTSVHHDLQEELCMAIIAALLEVAPALLIEVTTQKPEACPKAKAVGCTMRWEAHQAGLSPRTWGQGARARSLGRSASQRRPSGRRS